MQVVVKGKELMEAVQALMGEGWQLHFSYVDDMVQFLSSPKEYTKHTGELFVDSYASAYLPEREIIDKKSGFEKWFIEGNNPNQIKCLGYAYQSNGKKFFLIHKDAVLKEMPLNLDIHKMTDKAWLETGNGIAINTEIEDVYNEFLKNWHNWPQSSYRGLEVYYQEKDLEKMKEWFDDKPEQLVRLIQKNMIYFEKDLLQELIDWKGIKLFEEAKKSDNCNDVNFYEILLGLNSRIIIKENFIKNIYKLLSKEDKICAENSFEFLNSTMVNAKDINNVLDEKIFEVSLDLEALKNLYNQNTILKIFKNLNVMSECVLEYFGYEMINSTQITNNSKNRHYIEAQPKNIQLPELNRKVFVQHFSEVCEYLINNELRNEENKELVKIGITNWLEDKAMREQLESAGAVAKPGKKNGSIKF